MTRDFLKSYLIRSLEFWIEKVKTDECSIEEMESIATAIEKELNVRGTIADFSKKYGHSESNVRNVIARNYNPDKPKRQVTYRFGWFHSIVPKSWQ